MQLQRMLSGGAIGLGYEGSDFVVPAKSKEQALRAALERKNYCTLHEFK
jgi:hypothetical protein